MSQSKEDVYPPELSQYSTAGTTLPSSPAEQLIRDRELEVELAKLRIQEIEKRIELERLTQQRSTSSKDEYDQKPAAFTHAVERQIDLPRREIQRFDGNPKAYWAFTRAFESGVEKKTSDNQARLDYLIQYCDGPAKALIQHCTILEEDRGYLVAKEILHKRFGQNHMVAKAYIDELLDGPCLADHDSVALTQLAQQMTVCEVTLRQLNYDSDLDSSRTIETIVRRLPPELHFKWADEAAIITRHNREPQFADLTKFVEERADVACMRYGQLAINLKSELRGKPKQVNTRSNPLDIRRNIHLMQSDIPTTSNMFGSRLRCSICEDIHFPDQCQLFLSKSIEQRLEIVRSRKLCLQCLKANHVARDCRSNRSCNVEGCGRKHHRLLHFDTIVTPIKEPSTIANHHAAGFHPNDCTQAPTGKPSVALAVVPVTIRYGENTVHTYAFLDNGSDCTLVDEKIVAKLGMHGCKRQLKLCTLNRDTTFESVAVQFDVSGNDSKSFIHVERAWSVKTLPKLHPLRPSPHQLSTWTHLRGISFGSYTNSDIGILIGCDVPEAHWVIEQRKGKAHEPYAIRTVLGWTVLGPVNRSMDARATVNFVSGDEFKDQLEKLYQQDFIDEGPEKDKEMSLEDRQAFVTMENSIRLTGGHYEVALPWRTRSTLLPNNRCIALKRLYMLRRRLVGSGDLAQRYFLVMEEYIKRGHAELAPEGGTVSTRWYLPHHPVFHPAKPNKLRIVFDCAAKYANNSLNNQLLSGPDLTNSLVGVLLRFRQEKVAVMADIEAMFHQVLVPEKDRDVLRFLWWSDVEMQGPPLEYRMCVHLFGATSSPSCATFALRKTISDNAEHYDADVLRIAEKGFYVDDCLFSVTTIASACYYANQLKSMLARGGFNLVKWTSNDEKLLSMLPESEHSLPTQPLALGEPNMQRALGLQWNVKDDVYKFDVRQMEKPFTRRNILSYVSSIYDPLGYIAPVTLIARWILQRLCKLQLSWDDLIEGEELVLWTKWLSTLPCLNQFSLQRCLQPKDVEKCNHYQVHIFSDASEIGYGAVAYLVMSDDCQTKHCSLIIAKARVAPIRMTTMPRLELAAAVVAVKLAKQVQRELELPIESTTFWTDSMIVLHSVLNSSKRFQTFFANRLATIHEASRPEQWHYVDTKRNPADHVSRGIYAHESQKLNWWLLGPAFLCRDESEWPCPVEINHDTTKDIERVCNATTSKTLNHPESFISRFEDISSWSKLQRTIAWLLRYKQFILKRKQTVCTERLTAQELEEASNEICRLVQQQTFPTELKKLNNYRNSDDTLKAHPESIKKILGKDRSPLRKLNPFQFKGILRVGGRLQQSALPYDTKHPIILPSKHFVTVLLIRHYHVVNGHMGLGYILSIIRQRFWILTANKAIKDVLYNCYKCRRWFSQPCQQAMAPLPIDRTEIGVYPFTITGVDYFGPIYVKRGRGTEKRYGCLFTCFSTRAVHIEVAHSLDTDSFLCAFNRFVARRGCPRRLYSDNGTNFKGAADDVKRLLQTWNDDKIAKTLVVRGCDWIFNPPKASHRGGVWERIIRTIKRIILITLQEQTVSDEVLHTTLLEIERILNDRPLVKQTEDPDDQYVLTPSKLLLLRGNSSISVVPVVNENRFNRRWRVAQYLTDVFWSKWVKCYLPTLQTIQRWQFAKPNLKRGDLVLLLDLNAPRGHWSKAVVEEAHEGPDGLVRDVIVRTPNGQLRRDVRQLCKLEGDLKLSDPDENNV